MNAIQKLRSIKENFYLDSLEESDVNNEQAAPEAAEAAPPMDPGAMQQQGMPPMDMAAGGMGEEPMDPIIGQQQMHNPLSIVSSHPKILPIWEEYMNLTRYTLDFIQYINF